MTGNAAIYISDPSMMGSRVFDTLDAVRCYEGRSKRGSATGVQFVLDAGTVTMNFMPEQDMAAHLAGLSGFVEQVVPDKDQLLYALGRVHYVRMVCGCVIEPGFDEAGEIESFLFAFCAATRGLLLYSNAVFDYDGTKLGGL